MSINKFGASLRESEVGGSHHRHLPGIDIIGIQNFISDKVLLLNGENYDAKRRRISQLANPQDDTDVTNKSYVSKEIDTVTGTLIKRLNDKENDLKFIINNKTLCENEQKSFDAKLQKIVRVRNPSEDNDAVNMGFLINKLGEIKKKIDKRLEDLKNSVDSKKIQETTNEIKKNIETTRKDFEEELLAIRRRILHINQDIFELKRLTSTPKQPPVQQPFATFPRPSDEKEEETTS